MSVTASQRAMEPSTEVRLKALELDDSDDDVMQSNGSDISGDSEGEADIRYVWDGGCSKTRSMDSKIDSSLISAGGAVDELKSKGNQYFKNKKYKEALKMYNDAVSVLETNGEGVCDETTKARALAVLHSNLSATLLHLRRLDDALKHAQVSRDLAPEWSKPLFRMAKVYVAQGDFPAALTMCQEGEAMCRASHRGITEFTPLFDEIVVQGAVSGLSDALFTGRRLEVRPAGDEAWLGKPAPYVPALDGPLDEDTALPSDDLSGTLTSIENDVSGPTLALGDVRGQSAASARADALAQWSFSNTSLAIQSQRTSFRCIGEAYKAAKDGDRIVLLKGIHNGLGETVKITKRILIEGEGQLGETVVDQRANVPTFKIERGGVVIRNLDIDHTGFREAILIDGTSNVNPLIEGCDIKCSGDDCFNIGGASKPLIRFCKIKAKKTGIKCFDNSFVNIDASIIEGCAEVGLQVMDESRVTARRCSISRCEEDGLVVMGKSKCSLMECKISENKGTGADCSDDGFLSLSRCHIADNVGGCWAWNDATIIAQQCTLNGGPAHVLLTHNNGVIDAKSCNIQGSIHAPERVWNSGLLDQGNAFADPDKPVDFPIEAGAFAWSPSPYTSI
jgi:tetratricopeptide (TPR) repeat protein